MTAAEARTRGDATPAQRDELRQLIEQKSVTDEWVNQFYVDICAAEGLSKSRAERALAWLREQPDRSEQPVYATAEQAEEIRRQLRIRVYPKRWAEPLVDLLDAGKLPHVKADQMIAELNRMTLRSFVAPDAPAATVGGFEDGYYALRDGADKPRHYRVKTVGGLRQVDQITYTKNRSSRSRLRFRQAMEVIRAISADPAAAAVLYAETAKRCTDCGRPIRDTGNNPGFPHGYGPDCWDDREARRLNRDVKAEIADNTPGEPMPHAPLRAAS